MLDFAVIKVKPADTPSGGYLLDHEFPKLMAFICRNCVPSADVCVGDPRPNET